MWESLLCAIGLVCIIEGIFPLIAPEKWQEMIREIGQIPSQKIRNVAFVSVVFGLVLIWSTMF